MAVTIIELLNDIINTVSPCDATNMFWEFDWSLSLGLILISKNIASLLWTYEDEKFDASNVISCPPEFTNSQNFGTNFYVKKKTLNKMMWSRKN